MLPPVWLPRTAVRDLLHEARDSPDLRRWSSTGVRPASALPSLPRNSASCPISLSNRQGHHLGHRAMGAVFASSEIHDASCTAPNRDRAVPWLTTTPAHPSCLRRRPSPPSIPYPARRGFSNARLKSRPTGGRHSSAGRLADVIDKPATSAFIGAGGAPNRFPGERSSGPSPPSFKAYEKGV